MKTPEQIQAMVDRLKQELRDLPEKNIFGDRNDEERFELETWKDELINFLESGELPNEHSDVRYWLDGNMHSALNDFD